MKDERDIREKIRDGEYKPKGPYPTRPIIRNPPLNGNASDYRRYAEELEAYEVEMMAYKRACCQYSEEESRHIAAFDRDLMDHLGITGHLKAAQLYAIAYSRGHSAGMEDVVSIAEELAELIR